MTTDRAFKLMKGDINVVTFLEDIECPLEGLKIYRVSCTNEVDLFDEATGDMFCDVSICDLNELK
jgi:hypothetical protein